MSVRKYVSLIGFYEEREEAFTALIGAADIIRRNNAVGEFSVSMAEADDGYEIRLFQRQ